MDTPKRYPMFDKDVHLGCAFIGYSVKFGSPQVVKENYYDNDRPNSRYAYKN